MSRTFGLQRIALLICFASSWLCSTQAFGAKFKTYDVPGAIETDVNAINNKNHATGYYLDLLGVAHGFFVSSNGGDFMSFDFPGATATFAYGINDRDEIVGWYVDSGGTQHGFAYHLGSFLTIDPPNSTLTNAWDVNYADEVVGTFFDSTFGKYRAFWFFRGIYNLYDAPGAVHTEFHGIDHGGGTPVGIYLDSNFVQHGFMVSNKFIDITHKGSALTATDRIAQDGSNNVVGYYGDTDSGPFTGYGIRDAYHSEKFIPVTYPGASSTWVRGMNSNGWLVGRYADSAGTIHGFARIP